MSDEGQISWFANLPHRDPLTLAQASEVSPEEWLRVLRNAFAADRTSAAAIIAATSPADLMVIGGLEIMPTAPVWSHGRSVIVGDAAHVPSPSSGQGASMAIESAIELARCLRDLPYAQAFAAYETLQRDRVTRMIRLAARTNSHKAAGPLARRVRDLIMPMAMKLAKPEKTAWQYNHHAVRDLDGAPLLNEESVVAAAAKAAALAAAGQTARAASQLLSADHLQQVKPTYYGAAWNALARLMLSEETLGGCPPLVGAI